MGISGSQSTAGLQTHGSKKKGREEARGDSWEETSCSPPQTQKQPRALHRTSQRQRQRAGECFDKAGKVAPSTKRRDCEVSTSDTVGRWRRRRGGRGKQRRSLVLCAVSSLECEEHLNIESSTCVGSREALENLRMASTWQLCYDACPSGGTACVVGAVRNNAALKSLCISGGWFGDDDAEALGHALAGNTSFENLDLFSCSFGARGLRGIAEALKTRRTISFISVNDMVNIGGAGAEIIADLLSSTSSLRSLELMNFMNCNIGAPGSTSIAKALKINTSLKSLTMSFNGRIGDAGAIALADALATTTSLPSLWLVNCGIGEQGGLALGRALGANLALPLDFELSSPSDNIPGVREEAARVRALVLLGRQKLVAFGMAMIKRLGGGPSAEEGSTTPSRERSTFHYMCKDVFRLVGDAYAV